MFSRPTSSLIGIAVAGAILTSCSSNSTQYDCFEVAEQPSQHPQKGICNATGVLEQDGADYVVRSASKDVWFFLGDTEVIWSTTIEELSGQVISTSGQYRLLEGQYLTLKEISSLELTE